MTRLICIIILSLIGIIWQVYTLNLAKKWKCIIGLMLCLGMLYMPLGIIFKFGTIIPHELVLLCSLITSISILFFSIGIFRLMIVIIIFIFNIIPALNVRFYRDIFLSSKLSLVSLIVAIFLGIFASYEAAKVPTVNHYNLYYKNLPKELDGYIIAHISDTHAGVLFRQAWHEAIVKKVMAEKVNLIVHTGDMGDGTPEQVQKSIAPLLKLSAPDGVYYVMGNHENYHHIELWRKYYQDKGLNILEAKYHLHKSLPLAIVGASAGARATPINYEKLLENIPQDSFTLLLDHFPSRASKAKDFVDLQLSGHTHGGTTFYLAPIVAYFNEGFVNGLYELGDMKLFVTSCVGLWSYAPLRLFVPSEIAIIHLKVLQ